MDDPSTPAADSSQSPLSGGGSSFFWTALLFELGLGGLALLVARVLRFDLRGGAPLVDLPALGGGVLAAMPLFAGLVLLQTHTPRWLDRFNQDFRRTVVPLFAPLTVLQMGLISVAAGVGEELLFRALLQALLSNWWGGAAGTMAGLVVASIGFGLCHWLNATYAVITTVVGLYLGALLIFTEQWMVPAVCHAAYDFAALVYLTRFTAVGRADEP